ncbi:MAG: hypothetical protein ABIP59_01030 [Roseateles sp.]
MPLPTAAEVIPLHVAQPPAANVPRPIVGTMLPDANEPVSPEVLAVQARHPWRKHVHDPLLETIDLRRRDLTRMSDAELRSETEKLVREILDRFVDLPAHIDREALRKELLDEAVGLALGR